jgi:hypothetical protein
MINEYGSNMMKHKYDPLKTIEAKSALYDCSKENFFQIDDLVTKSGVSKSLPTILEDKEVRGTVDRVVSRSPVKSSQGAPKVDLSSQEEILQKESQEIDWELIEEEDGQKSEIAEIDMDTTQQKESPSLVHSEAVQSFEMGVVTSKIPTAGDMTTEAHNA